MKFSVSDAQGHDVSVEADDWLTAAAFGLKLLGVDPSFFQVLTCTQELDGSVDVVGGRGRWRVCVDQSVASVGASSDLGPTPSMALSSNLPFFQEDDLPVLHTEDIEPLPDLDHRLEPGAETLPELKTEDIEPVSASDLAEHRPLDQTADEENSKGSRDGRADALPQPTEAPDPASSSPIAQEKNPLKTLIRSVPSASTPSPEIRVVASTRSEELTDASELFAVEPRHEPSENYTEPPPSLIMPSTSLEREDAESLAERIFDLSMDLAIADPHEASVIALDLVNEFVLCEASSVALGSMNDSCLTYVAASGPVANKILGRTLEFGRGIAGMAFDARSTISVSDVSNSESHYSGFDDETGFATLATLCVPILDEDGLVHGVIQLLNPTSRPFFDEDEEAVEMIARTLAGVFT